jgi:hypothetical protein
VSDGIATKGRDPVSPTSRALSAPHGVRCSPAPIRGAGASSRTWNGCRAFRPSKRDGSDERLTNHSLMVGRRLMWWQPEPDHTDGRT